MTDLSTLSFSQLSPAARAKFDEFLSAERDAGGADAIISAAVEKVFAAVDEAVGAITRAVANAGSDERRKRLAAEFGQLAAADLVRLLAPADDTPV